MRRQRVRSLFPSVLGRTIIFVALGPAVACTGHVDDREPDEEAIAPERSGPAPRDAGLVPAPSPEPLQDAAVGAPAKDTPDVAGAKTDMAPPREPQAAAPLGYFSPGALAGRVDRAKAACVPAGQMVSPSTLSETFARSCAGCHGAKGEGVEAFPPVPGKLGFAEYRAVVRMGRHDKMPAFTAAQADDVTLFGDFVTLSGRAAAVPAGLACDDGSDAAWTAPRYQAAITAGLAAWRKPDQKDGAACSSCHGPAPIDLAFIGFDDASIMRRALLHLPSSDGFAIIEMVRALRAKLGLAPRGNVLSFRPFQPGGKVLGADIAGDFHDQSYDPARAAEMDHVFAKEFAKSVPTLAGTAIQDLSRAKKARDEMLAINPRTYPIAIALNRWSEDKHRGPTHGSIADWLPDLPSLPNDAAARARIEALQDAYLANPTWEGIVALDKAIEADTTPKGIAGDLAPAFTLKHRSVLFAQHQFLLEAAGQAGLTSMGAAPFEMRNPTWSFADHIRVYETRTNNCGTTVEGCLGLPKAVADAVTPGRVVAHEMNRLKMPWFWVGWQFDTTLFHTGASNSTKTSEYFLADLYTHGYYVHVVYSRFRKNLAAAYESRGSLDPKIAGGPANAGRGMASAEALNFGYVFGYGRGIEERLLPPAGEKRDLYLRLMANVARMFFYLVEDELRTKPPAKSPVQLTEFPDSPVAQFLLKHGGGGAADKAVIESVRKLTPAAP